jgi:hypothetical protein
VVVALVVIVALWVALCCFRRQKRQSAPKKRQDLEIADVPAAMQGHEMMTTANTHEMDAKRPAHFQVKDVKPDIPEGYRELESLQSPAVRSIIRPKFLMKMDVPYNTQSTNVGSDWERLQPMELEGNTGAQQRAELYYPPMDPGLTSIHPPVAPPPILSTPQTEWLRSLEQEPPSAPIASSSAPSSLEDKLGGLRKRMERVREDKERLEKIQALKELEEELQAEILAEQKKAAGTP